jgi:chemotaxis protein methyltransferase CheR
MALIIHDSQLSRISALIEQRIGLTRNIFGAALSTVLDSVAGDDLAAFTRTLQDTPETSPHWQSLLQALMIGETYFFRHRAQLNWLRDIILPEILETSSDNVNIWSAGCASGEEVYSIAITIYEAVRAVQRRNIRLIGTDVNKSALELATRGRYRTWSFRQSTDLFRQTYFDEVEGELCIKPYIQHMVTLSQRNLLAGAPVTPLDVIMCCNVLLYFTEEASARVETLFFEALRPGGWLLLGQAEALRFGRERWQMHLFPGGAAYQKPRADTHQPRVAIYHETPLHLSPDAIANQNSDDSDYPEALHALRRKQYDKAATIIHNILTAAPGDDRAYVLMGYILANRDQAAEAQTKLDRALHLNSLNADAHYLKGVLYLEQGETEQAAEALRSALYCQPGHPLASIILGNLYLQTSQADKAQRIWTTALETLQPMSPEAPVSDLSDMTAGSIINFLQTHRQ